MRRLITISGGLDRLVTAIAKVAAWASVLLIAVTIFDVITRRFLVLGSTKLQELEWHFHTVLFGFLIGYAYLRDAHVRIDLIRERLSDRIKWWIELTGCLLFLLPFCALVIYFSYDFALRSFVIDESSSAATGLGHRWIIKSVVPIGFTLLALSGIAVVLRKIVELFGPPDLRARMNEAERAEAEPLIRPERDGAG